MEHAKVMSQLVRQRERIHLLNPCVPQAVTHAGHIRRADRVRAPKPSEEHDDIPSHVAPPLLSIHRPHIVDDGSPPPARRERVLCVVAVPVHADQHETHARRPVWLASNVHCRLYHS